MTNTVVTTLVNITGTPVNNTVANHVEKPEKFNGHNFKRWQQKMFFYLTTLNLARFLNETAPQVKPPTEGQPSNAQAMQAVEAWKHSDFLCHNYVLNGLVDDLYNVYCKTRLPKNYRIRWNASTKLRTLVQDLQVLLHDIHAEGMTEMSVEDLIVHLRIEEDNKLAQKNTYAPDSAKANIVEHAGSSSKSNSKAKGKCKKKNDKKGKGKAEYLAPKAGILKQKFQGTCNNCDQPGHRAANYKMPKRVNPRQANMVNDNMDMIAMVSDIITMISEVNLIRKNLVSGWLLNKFYFRLVFESDKFVLSKNQMYVGKGYAVNGMFKLNVIVVKNDINKINSPVYLNESSNVWHGHLGHIPRKEKEETPYELWMGRKPSYQYLRVWGCLAKVVVPTPKAQKIGPKSMDCIFIGYAKNSSAYRFIVHDSKNPDIQKNAVMESRNASFFENIFPCLTKETGSSSRLDEEVVQDKRQRDDNDLHDERQDQLEEEEVEPRRSKRARTEKSFGPDFVSFMVENEPTSYREVDINSRYVILCLYVDDMLIIRSNEKIIKSTKDMLKSKFDMKDMGLADMILGIKIIRTHNGLMLSQEHYVDKIINTQNAGDSGLARTPIDTNLHLSKNRDARVAQLEYSRVIGMLMYLMTSTRPNLAYAISRLSRYTSNSNVAALESNYSRVLSELKIHS
ncbi:retrotransposon protein, putative, ty1-copia subclass [Tanacetum coccineum]